MISWFSRCGLATLCLLLTGCATKQAFPVHAADPQAVVVEVAGPREAAAFVALPGDILVMHLGDSEMGSWAKQLGVYPAGLVDLLDLQDPFVKYLHAEVIEDIPDGNRLKTYGFYPLIKEYHRNQFGRSFSVFSVPEADRARVLKRAASEGYGNTGYCGDFVSWCFDNRIYSWWNQIPGLQRAIAFIYPFEAIQTADHIAQSPDTEQVYETLGGKLIYPLQIDTQTFVARLDDAAGSNNIKVVAHIARIRGRLKTAGILSPNGNIIKPTFELRW